MMTPSWTPRRDGKTYCAPACGYGCTWAKYEAAVSAASALARDLGEGWEPHVWENIGWHYEVRRPHLRVYPNLGGRGFTALLSRDPNGPGGHWSAQGADAHQAIRLVLADARKEARAMVSLLKVLGEPV